MKQDKLVDAIGMIDDEYIKEAREVKKQKSFSLKDIISWNNVGKFATAAVCLMLVVNILPDMFHSYKSSDDGYTSSDAYYESYSSGSYYAAPSSSPTGGGLYSNSYSNVMELEDSVSYYADYDAEIPSYEETASEKTESQKKMILTANLKMETQDLDETVNLLSSDIKKYEGYVQKSSSYTRSSTTRVYEATIRIPAEKYESFLEELSSAGNTVSYNDEIEDITDSYTDIESRIAALKAQEEKVMEFYEKAETIDDLMSIESRLSDLQYQIEYYETQIKNYDLLVAYSTLYITITETKVYTPSNPNFFERLASSFSSGWHNFIDGISDFLIDIVYNIWTILLLIVVAYVGYIVFKKIKNRINK